MGKKVNSRSTVRKDFLHNHHYYNRECKICRQYVRDIYNDYFENALSMNTMPNRRRANCGHSCLKFTLIFYCAIIIITSICVICYSSKMFGMMSSLEESLPKLNNSRIEIYSIIVSSVVMLIFFIGLIGSILESLLCLRIFGGIIAYLFLLTFGSFLYTIILLILSNASAKLIASVVSCAAAAIIIHASMAITPFAFADLIHQEREDDKSETYVKYPSVRYLPHNGSYPLVSPYPPYGYSSQGPVIHDINESRFPTAKTSQVRFEDDWL